jgi:hypothetical protein
MIALWWRCPLESRRRPVRGTLVGLQTALGKVRVSSRVELFDLVSRRAVTSSGTVYELRGEPGLSGAALATWLAWKDFWGVSLERDVTAEVSELLDASRWPAS